MFKIGDKISADKFHVSKYNVRFGQPFGTSDEDKSLIEQLRRGKIIHPFKARSEDSGYGVYAGRRKFLSKKQLGAKTFEVGKDCLIENISEEEAREESLVENLSILQKSMDPITRAEGLNAVMSFGGGGLRTTAARLGIAPSTLSEYLKVLELSPAMQAVVRKGLIPFRGKGMCSALGIAKLGLGLDAQDMLADLVRNEGRKALAKELDRRMAGIKKRGIPKDTYKIIRLTFDNRWKDAVKVYQKLDELAKAEGVKLDEYVKQVLSNHVKSTL